MAAIKLSTIVGGGLVPPSVLTGILQLSGSTPDWPTNAVDILGVVKTTIPASPLTALLDITGSGVIEFLAVGNDGSIEVKITIDGVVVHDATVAASGNTSLYCFIGSAWKDAAAEVTSNRGQVIFNTSLKIECQSGGFLFTRHYLT